MPGQRRIIYLGWQGFGNFGDDLLHDTWKGALADPLELQAPVTRRAYLKAAPKVIGQRMSLTGAERIILLGGGTTIGFQNWGRAAHLALRYYRAEGLVIAGSGAAAPHDRFALGLQRDDWETWRALRDVALCGVRGPLTADVCVRQWRATNVIGDPALLYPLQVGLPSRGTSQHLIGVCLGASPATRFSTATVVRAITAYRAAYPESLVRVLQLFPEDAGTAQDLASRLDSAVVTFDGNVRAMVRAIGECSVLLSERLHGAVVGVASGVPTVPLAYASKCDDFWLSVTGESPNLQVGATSEQIAEELRRATEPSRISVVADHVRCLQDSLEKVVAAVRQWKTGQLTTGELLSWANGEVRATTSSPIGVGAQSETSK
ncbi:polysaccharide pyruvyl transferase family protein [Streptomyces sp. NPDC002935]|uniref:polysaccharide pyruvyl transferase family protein n=1 Tax=Streptomyces sp. NPDC002935 TaxID=3154545 RepID=UPI0033A4E5D6